MAGGIVVTFYSWVSSSDYSRIKTSENTSPLADFAKLDAISIAHNAYSKNRASGCTILRTRQIDWK